MKSNPLLSFDDLPLFDQVRPEHVAPAIEHLLAPVSYTHLTLPTIYSV